MENKEIIIEKTNTIAEVGKTVGAIIVAAGAAAAIGLGVARLVSHFVLKVD